MNIEQYWRLLQAFSKIAGLDPHALREDGAVSVDGIDMQLLFNEAADSEAVHVRVDLDTRFDEVGSDVHRALLAANYDSPPEQLLKVSVHPPSGNLVITFRLPLGLDVSGETLANDLQRHARDIREWWHGFRIPPDSRGASEARSQMIAV
jgi:hypothetical protein